MSESREKRLMPGAEPFEMAGGGIGVLLVHGFTGSPQSMRPWGEFLAAEGLTVSCPLLPGHGTRWQDMNRTRWQDWYAAAEGAFTSLRERCEAVFVMGLSMGGTLTLLLAQRHAAEVAGAVVVNPSLTTDRWYASLAPVLAKIVPSLPGIASDIKAPGVREVAYRRVPVAAFASLRQLWAVTRPGLNTIVCPVLAFRSVTDHVVEASSGRLLLAGATSCSIEERLLPNSFHVATLDNDKDLIFQGSLDFVRAHAPLSSASDG